MHDYRPSNLPDTLELDTLLKWLRVEFALVQGAMPGSIPIFPTTFVAPAKPRAGMIVFADGTEWNPGSGVGFYGYTGSAWVKF